MLTLGVVTDVHFGPEARFGGQLRKLTGEAPALLEAFLARMRDHVRPDAIVNLGDCIEDESPAADLERYTSCVRQLEAGAPPEAQVIHVAGNHDRVHLLDEQLLAVWDQPALYRSFSLGGFRIIVLATSEAKDERVYLEPEQLGWLERELEAHAGSPVVILMHHSAAEQALENNRWFATAPHLCLLENRAQLRALLGGHVDVRLVLNGHLHWNHVAVIDGIPYVTVQSLIENVDEDAPGRAAAAYAVVRLSERSTRVDVAGAHPLHLHFNR